MTETILIDGQNLSVILEKAFTVATAIVTVASVIAAFTPTPRDDTFIGKLYRLIELLAVNVGRAKETPPNRAGGRFTFS
ncbi:hypothetical protein ACQ5SO_05775 [Rhodovulum sp. DZ06]|uniref:hypothetical protein n=1 Tax=Rhodovulum sp. DZ06 TaxID=3425126 RepID=UPI003D355D2A